MPGSSDYDVVVVGAGTMGASAAYHLAAAAAASPNRTNAPKILLLERHSFGGHPHGSSHGGSRIIRMTDGKPHIAKLAHLARKEWDALAKVAVALGEDPSVVSEMYRKCGGLDMGDPQHPQIQAVLKMAKDSSSVGVEETGDDEVFDELTADEIHQRWPTLCGVPSHWVGIYNRNGGVLSPDVVVPLLQRLAVKLGVEARGHSNVQAIIASRSGTNAETPRVKVKLEDGTQFTTKRVVIAAGSWTQELLAKSLNFHLPLAVWEIAFGWYSLKRAREQVTSKSHVVGKGHTAYSDLPVWRSFGADARCYGFPEHEKPGFMKVAPFGDESLVWG